MEQGRQDRARAQAGEPGRDRAGAVEEWAGAASAREGHVYVRRAERK